MKYKNMMYEEFLAKEFYPFIRKKMSLYLVKEEGYSQKSASKMLKLTEGAVSQYLNNKRAVSGLFDQLQLLTFNHRMKQLIKKEISTRNVINNLTEDTRISLRYIFTIKYGEY